MNGNIFFFRQTGSTIDLTNKEKTINQVELSLCITRTAVYVTSRISL